MIIVMVMVKKRKAFRVTKRSLNRSRELPGLITKKFCANPNWN